MQRYFGLALYLQGRSESTYINSNTSVSYLDPIKMVATAINQPNILEDIINKVADYAASCVNANQALKDNQLIKDIVALKNASSASNLFERFIKMQELAMEISLTKGSIFLDRDKKFFDKIASLNMGDYILENITERFENILAVSFDETNGKSKELMDNLYNPRHGKASTLQEDKKYTMTKEQAEKLNVLGKRLIGISWDALKASDSDKVIPTGIKNLILYLLYAKTDPAALASINEYFTDLNKKHSKIWMRDYDIAINTIYQLCKNIENIDSFITQLDEQIKIIETAAKKATKVEESSNYRNFKISDYKV